MTNEYSAPYVLTIKILDTISFLVGLFILSYPIIHLFYPGAFDTTVHVTLGALIAVCSVFRILVAYGSAWLEIVLCALGVLVFFLPVFMHMHYDPQYRLPHQIAGLLLIAISIISAALTFSQLRKIRLAH